MEISVRGARLNLLMIPIIGISITGSNYIQSIGKSRVAMMLSLLRQVIMFIPLLIVLPKFFGLDGIWYAQVVSDFLSTVITAVILYRELKTYKNFETKQDKIIA